MHGYMRSSKELFFTFSLLPDIVFLGLNKPILIYLYVIFFAFKLNLIYFLTKMYLNPWRRNHPNPFFMDPSSKLKTKTPAYTRSLADTSEQRIPQ